MFLRSTNSLKKPESIISLVPSQTELLYDLGLDIEIKGITKFCIHPKSWRKEKKIVGGTKNLRFLTIQELNPDLIIANKEENNKADIEALAHPFNVWVTDVKDTESAIQMIEDIGSLTDRSENARIIIKKIKAEKEKLQQQILSIPRIKVCYLIWQEPYMTIGSDNFIHDMLKHGGMENVFAHKTRYPEISEAEIRESNPDYILLSSEPYPFGAKHLDYFAKKFPQSKTVCIDGEMCSWYGSRMTKGFPYLFRFLQTVL